MSGPSTSDRFEMHSDRLVWYVPYQNTTHLTGVLYSEEGQSFLGANSRRTYYGWCDDNFLTTHNFDSGVDGIQVQRTTYTDKHVIIDCDVDIGTSDNSAGNLGVGQTANIRTLEVWDGASMNKLNVYTSDKNRVVPTSFYWTKITTLESPTPSFCDYGRAKTDENGAVTIVLDPRFQEAISIGELCWFFQAKDGSNLSYEEIIGGCVVKGNPNTDFNWYCIKAQFDAAGIYADRCEDDMPVPYAFFDYEDLSNMVYDAEMQSYKTIGVLESEE